MPEDSVQLAVPAVTEEQLLEFHERVFGKPPQVQEDDLGYYKDGVKRTLTDDQIAMFRHSEIHSLLQQSKREEAEAESPEDPAADSSSNDEAEYARFLEKEQQELEEVKAKKKRKQEHDRTISTRRRVRELDDAQAPDQVLDYDDAPAEDTVQGKKIWWPSLGP